MKKRWYFLSLVAVNILLLPMLVMVVLGICGIINFIFIVPAWPLAVIMGIISIIYVLILLFCEFNAYFALRYLYLSTDQTSRRITLHSVQIGIVVAVAIASVLFLDEFNSMFSSCAAIIVDAIIQTGIFGT